MTGTYLYVEDDPLSREIMEVLLNEVIGVGELVVFEDSQDFMDRLKALNKHFDFIFLDIHVEPYDGFEILEMLRSDPDYQDTKILAVTASVMSSEVNRLKHVGFDGTLAKPLDMLTFPDLIHQLEEGEQIWQVQ